MITLHEGSRIVMTFQSRDDLLRRLGTLGTLWGDGWGIVEATDWAAAYVARRLGGRIWVFEEDWNRTDMVFSCDGTLVGTGTLPGA